MTERWWGADEAPQRAERFIRIAAYALCVDDGRILLARISRGFPDAGSWTLPGGGLEFGEPPDTGLLRELEEESGLRGDVLSLLAVDSELYGPRPGRESWVQSLRIVYRVGIVGGDLRHERDGSSDQCAWLPLEEVDSLALVSLAQLGARLAREAPPR